MKDYFEFSVNGTTAKAYKTLENIYEIESIGINLTQIFFDIANSKILSFTIARKILDIAIKADISDLKQRAEFVKDFFDKKRFKACDEVSFFILELLKTPKDDSVVDENSDTEKK